MNMQSCPLCPQNKLLKVPIIAEAPDAYLISAFNSPGNYLIIPRVHTEQLKDLPDTWWPSVVMLLEHIPKGDNFNVSINIGSLAGQSVPHIHFWVIPRHGGQPASGKGFARLIDEVNGASNK